MVNKSQKIIPFLGVFITMVLFLYFSFRMYPMIEWLKQQYIIYGFAIIIGITSYILAIKEARR